MVTLAYEYSSSKNNNVIVHGVSLDTVAQIAFTGETVLTNNVVNQASQISTIADSTGNTRHTNKNTTVNFVSGIDILTGTITYSAYEGSGYGNTSSVTGVPVDKEVDAMNDPYTVPGRLTIFEGLAPVAYNHTTAH